MIGGRAVDFSLFDNPFGRSEGLHFSTVPAPPFLYDYMNE